MSLSASVHHTTSEAGLRTNREPEAAETRISREDVSRIVILWASGISAVVAFLFLFWLLATSSHDLATARTLHQAAIGVTATICGTVGAGMALIVQRNAETERKRVKAAAKAQADEAEEMGAIRNEIRQDRLKRAELAAAVSRLSTLIEKRMEHEAEVDKHSAKARGDVAEIRDVLSRVSLDLGEERLAAIADGVARKSIRAFYTALRDAVAKRGGPGWSPTDIAWMEDVAAAFELGQQFGPDPDPE